MTEIAVMYGDLSIVRVPWAERESLRRDYVLSIAILQPDRPRKHTRYQAVCEFDYYVLAWSETDCYLGGYDDNLYWFSLTEPWKKYGEGFIHKFPFILPENSILFEGVMIDKDEYAKAKKIFLDRDGGMY